MQKISCKPSARMRRRVCAMGVLLAAFGTPGLSLAQVSATLNGAPVQVTPYMPEPGVPTIEIPQGTPTPPPTTTNDGTASSNTSDALNTMLAQSWGSTAIANAQALGLNPSALAATCVIESGCGADVGDGTGAQGAFQMFPAAYTEGLQTALAADPSLASQIVSGSAGMTDPTTEAIAASGYLMQANSALQSVNISSPTVLDTRSYYEFGPTYGPAVATADPTALMSSVVPSNFLSSNDISSSETVAQWQAATSAKIGNAANQSVLSS